MASVSRLLPLDEPPSLGTPEAPRPGGGNPVPGLFLFSGCVRQRTERRPRLGKHGRIPTEQSHEPGNSSPDFGAGDGQHTRGAGTGSNSGTNCRRYAGCTQTEGAADFRAAPLGALRRRPCGLHRTSLEVLRGFREVAVDQSANGYALQRTERCGRMPQPPDSFKDFSNARRR